MIANETNLNKRPNDTDIYNYRSPSTMNKAHTTKSALK